MLFIILLSPVLAESFVFIEEFSHASGAACSQLNGDETTDTNGKIHSYAYTYAGMPENATGELVMAIKEEDEIKGPDGKRGVLSFEIISRSTHTDYFGFSYLGSPVTGRIRMPVWERGKTKAEDMKRSFISFKYKAVNERFPKKAGLIFNFRFEPDIKDSWHRRAEIGKLTAETEWQVYRQPLSKASNIHAFVNCINREKPEAFKFIFSHASGIDRYDEGDKLLIDDVEIRVLKK
ncbi:MAG: hypothetical protein QF473_08960 [Planctomycetota bacterium]|jgi:hypothetical protein|nr:hypothetical protein [Planctomycetota bacterium]